MAYAQGTMTSPNPSNDMRTIIDGLLISAGWTLVETLTPSGVFRNSVYKSPGASNLCGYDWYIMLAWQATGSEQVTSIMAGGAYNSTTHVLSQLLGSQMGIPASGGGIVTDNSGLYAMSQTLNASTLTANTSGITIYYQNAANSNVFGSVPGIQTLLPSSAFAYWVSITLDHIFMFTTVSSGKHTDGVISTLARDPGFVADTNYFATPLVSWDIQPQFNVQGGLKGLASSSAMNYVASIQNFSGPFGPRLPIIHGTYYDAVAWKPYVWMADAQGALSSGTWDGTKLAGGLLIGHVPDFYMVYGGSIGDTVTIDSATYVLGPLVTATTGLMAGLTAAVLVES